MGRLSFYSITWMFLPPSGSFPREVEAKELHSQTTLFCTFVAGKFQKKKKEINREYLASVRWGGEVVDGKTSNPEHFWAPKSPGEGNGLELLAP